MRARRLRSSYALEGKSLEDFKEGSSCSDILRGIYIDNRLTGKAVWRFI
jgi:hypothetical protein